MKKNNILPFVWIITMVFSLGINGCKNQKSAKKTGKIQQEITKNKIQEHVRDFIYPLPTSYEVIQMLKDIGISYIIGISNPPDFVNQYLSSKSKAIALGVYGSDLSYASIYNMQQDIILYLETIKKLAQELDLQSVYNENIFNRINKNIDNKDTLVNILTNSLFESYNALNQNGKGDIALLMVAGGWVEALYLTTHVSKNSYNNYQLVKIIFDQKSSLNKLVDILNENKDKPSIQELAITLDPLKKLYDSIQGSLTEKQLNQIAVVAEKIRHNLLH